MRAITTIGLDLAKSVFQVHGIDAENRVIIRRQLKRRYVLAFFKKLPPCLVGIEACASSRYRSRELKALGHTVRTNVARAGGFSVSVINLFVQQSSQTRRKDCGGAICNIFKVGMHPGAIVI
jgi:transposase